MKTLITEFISLDGVVQAPGAAQEAEPPHLGRWTT